MNLASAYLKQVLDLQDHESWSATRKNYLPSAYHQLFKVIEKHCDNFTKLPTFEDLKFEIRDTATKELLFAIEAVEVEAEASMLLQYLKNEYTQKEILQSLEDYVDHSVSFESAEDSVDSLRQITIDIEDKVDLQDPQESMQRIPLFDPDEEMENRLSLGLNTVYDSEISFSPRDLILVGGRRGAGKSMTCANIANNVYESGKTAIYFTIEMEARSILQRCCSIATGIPHNKMQRRDLSMTEWETVARWWAKRYSNSEENLKEYLNNRDFDKFHDSLWKGCELLPTQQLDVIYDPNLTIAKIRSELDKKLPKGHNVGVVIVDYINQVKRSNMPSRAGQYDWTEQIEVSKALKSMAQDKVAPIVSPYQTDASGEARFAKGLLDSADAAFTLDAYTKQDECITFNCVKMRNAAETSFTSTYFREYGRMGPETAQTPSEKADNDQKTGEDIDDI